MTEDHADGKLNLRSISSHVIDGYGKTYHRETFTNSRTWVFILYGKLEGFCSLYRNTSYFTADIRIVYMCFKSLLKYICLYLLLFLHQARLPVPVAGCGTGLPELVMN